MADGIETGMLQGIAVWTLNRQDRSNAFDKSMVQRLHQLAENARNDSTIRAVIITGAGDKVFCAGADLKERLGLSLSQVNDLLDLYRKAFDAIDAMPVPVVAALNGGAFGGGLELALAADFRVAVPHAQLGLPETSLGIIPGAGGTQRLPRLIGQARAKELIVFARRISAQAALDIGLLNRLAAQGQTALECALEYLAPLQELGPLAVRAALQAIDRGAGLDLNAALDVERQCYQLTLNSQDRLEALKAFKAKRKPAFKGR